MFFASSTANAHSNTFFQNFKVYPQLEPGLKDGKKEVTFTGHREGEGVTFMVRVKTREMAEELKGALEREIEFVKAKDST
jgi:nucleoporin NUP2